MERGVIELFSKTSFTTTSTAEDFIPYLEEAAQRFCDVFGMIIYDDWTEAADKKASVYVGYEGDLHPLFRFCNSEYSNTYYNNFGICLTMDIGTQVSTNSNNGTQAKYQMCSTVSYPTYLSYIKDGGNIVFTLASTTSVPGYPTSWSWIITKAICGSESDTPISVPFAMHIYNQYVYASSDSRLGFASDQYAFTTVNQMLSAASPIVPRAKEAIMDQDICIYNTDDARITDLRLYSNKIGMPNGSTVRIAGVPYFLIYRYNSEYPTILLKLNE